MRCLYCGKELALLKRWTGGGEFCSDAHRQRYQEEYNQLALNRLLQAQPTETNTTLKSDAFAKPRPLPETKAPETKASVDVAPRIDARPEPRHVALEYAESNGSTQHPPLDATKPVATKSTANATAQVAEPETVVQAGAVERSSAPAA